MPHPKTTIKIHAAAFYFAHISRGLQDLVEIFGVSEFTVRKWAKTQAWENALEAFDYQGERHFITKPRRDTQRDNGETFEKARSVYLQAMRDGQPKHKLATIAGGVVGLPRRRIHAWAMKYNWRDVSP